MGTEFDDFSASAAPNSPEVLETSRKNRRLLSEAMAKEGFKVEDTEWWHFTAPGGKNYPILDVPLSKR